MFLNITQLPISMNIKNMPRLRIEDIQNECDLIKSVQLYVQEEPFLALGRKFHGTILDKILEDMGIHFNRIKLCDGTC